MVHEDQCVSNTLERFWSHFDDWFLLKSEVGTYATPKWCDDYIRETLLFYLLLSLHGNEWSRYKSDLSICNSDREKFEAWMWDLLGNHGWSIWWQLYWNTESSKLIARYVCRCNTTWATQNSTTKWVIDYKIELIPKSSTPTRALYKISLLESGELRKQLSKLIMVRYI